MTDAYQAVRDRLWPKASPVVIRRLEVFSTDAPQVNEPDPFLDWQTDDTAITVDLIVRAVCRFFRVQRLDLISERRTQNVVIPRQVVMYLAREMTPRSFPQIGKVLGGRDHTTIMYGHSKISRVIHSNPLLAEQISAIMAKLRAICEPDTEQP